MLYKIHGNIYRIFPVCSLKPNICRDYLKINLRWDVIWDVSHLIVVCCVCVGFLTVGLFSRVASKAFTVCLLEDIWAAGAGSPLCGSDEGCRASVGDGSLCFNLNVRVCFFYTRIQITANNPLLIPLDCLLTVSLQPPTRQNTSPSGKVQHGCLLA